MPRRRDLFKAVAAGAVVAPLPGLARGAADCSAPAHAWARGIEGQRRADLGDGSFLNPIVAGDHPDPTVLKDGDDYWMTFSSFHSYPGLVIWHSKDLVNWTPVGPTLFRNLGDIWAVDLCKHDGRYFIYIPANPTGKGWSIHAIWADDIRGPWSEPVDLGIEGCIDPGHAVGEDGRRYLFVNGIRKIRLSDDGLATDGELEQAYEPWRYPAHWITENFAPEGPKLFWRDGWLYLVTAVGGTAGPATGHMVIMARARSVHGPWEHCPHNPLVRSRSSREPWWSRGHATAVEGPAGDWWMVYHGYERGFHTLGRQTLLEPMRWSGDGWLHALGGDLSQPLRKPAQIAGAAHGQALSGPLSPERFGVQWCFHQPGPDDNARLSHEGDVLRLAAAGTSPADAAVLSCIVGDRAWRAEIALELDGTMRKAACCCSTARSPSSAWASARARSRPGSTRRSLNGRGSRATPAACACAWTTTPTSSPGRTRTTTAAAGPSTAPAWKSRACTTTSSAASSACASGCTPLAAARCAWAISATARSRKRMDRTRCRRRSGGTPPRSGSHRVFDGDILTSPRSSVRANRHPPPRAG